MERLDDLNKYYDKIDEFDDKQEQARLDIVSDLYEHLDNLIYDVKRQFYRKYDVLNEWEIDDILKDTIEELL